MFSHTHNPLVHVNTGVQSQEEQRWKTGAQTQGKETDDLRPLTSLPGQSRTPLFLVFNVSEEALSSKRDVPQAYLVKRGISSLMFTMFTRSQVDALSPWLSLTSTVRR